MEELKEMLINVNDSYFDFVLGIMNYAGKKPERLSVVKKYLAEHKDATSSDIVEFVSSQPDFYEDNVPPIIEKAVG